MPLSQNNHPISELTQSPQFPWFGWGVGKDRNLMKVRRVAKKYQRVEYHIDNSRSWDDFESLIKFAEKHYPSAMTKNRDGAYINGFLIKEDGVEVVRSKNSCSGKIVRKYGFSP